MFGPTKRLHADTIHSVKGQSRDAVLVIADHEEKFGWPAQAFAWTSHLLGSMRSTGDLGEEIRILYVALTRARRFCMLALPDGTPRDVIAEFEKVGFHLSATIDEGHLASVRKQLCPGGCSESNVVWRLYGGSHMDVPATHCHSCGTSFVICTHCRMVNAAGDGRVDCVGCEAVYVLREDGDEMTIEASMA
jgi:hypothetical protein